MRNYQLTIGSEEIASLGSSRFPGLRLEFEINATHDITNVAPSWVRVYNVDTQFLSRLDSFKNKTLVLTAGIERTPITKVCGINPTISRVVIGSVGFIASNWSGLENSVTFYVNSGIGSILVDTVYQINQGESVAQGVKSLLDKYFAKENTKEDGEKSAKLSFNVKITPLAGKVVSTNKNTIVFYPQQGELNGFKFFQRILETFKLKMAIENDTITIYSIGEALTTQVISLADTDYLDQPEWISNNNLSVNTILKPNIKLGATINLGGSGLSSASGLLSSLTSALNLTDSRLIAKGSFNVKSIVHYGDSHSSDASSWRTSFECVAVGTQDFTSLLKIPYFPSFR